MKSPKDKWCSHIDITNKCHIGDCAYCSRFIRHLRPDMIYVMDLAFIEKCLDSYKDFPNRIGIIGGEPLLHKDFAEICSLIRQKVPREKAGLWTSLNPEISRFSKDIKLTFGLVAFNEHNSYQQTICKHQPFTLACKDMIIDSDLRAELISDCWFGQEWCPTINPLGAFHCEIAASIAFLIGRQGWDIEPGWWKREDMSDQIDLCQLCGACIPIERQLICDKKERISPSFLEILVKHNLLIGDYELVNKPLEVEYMAEQAKTWRPGAYRGDLGESESIGSTMDWTKWLVGD